MRPARSRAGAALSSTARRRLMVVERGASLASRDDSAAFDETTALTQLAGETDTELAERALARVVSAQRSGRAFDSAFLVVGEAGSNGARRRFALGVAAEDAVLAQVTELVILAPVGASPALREDLLGLTDDLLSSAERSLPIRLCFATGRDAEQRSGTFWSIPEPDADEADTE